MLPAFFETENEAIDYALHSSTANLRLADRERYYIYSYEMLDSLGNSASLYMVLDWRLDSIRYDGFTDFTNWVQSGTEYLKHSVLSFYPSQDYRRNLGLKVAERIGHFARLVHLHYPNPTITHSKFYHFVRKIHFVKRINGAGLDINNPVLSNTPIVEGHIVTKDGNFTYFPFVSREHTPYVQGHDTIDSQYRACTDSNGHMLRNLAYVLEQVDGPETLRCPVTNRVISTCLGDASPAYVNNMNTRELVAMQGTMPPSGLGICENCGNVVALEFFTEEGYCQLCETEAFADDDREGLLNGYSYRPRPRFYYITKKGETKAFRRVNPKKQYFGVELEMHYQGSNAFQLALEEIQHKMNSILGNNPFYFKSDSSIPSPGAEVVSHPMTYKMLSDWSTWEWTQTAKDLGFTGFDSGRGSCGLHVHVTRASVSPMAFTRLYNLIMDPDGRNFLLGITYRTRDSLSHWGGPARTRRNPHRGDFSDLEVGRLARRIVRSQNRYSAINCTPNTLEFRCFRATLNQKALMRNFQYIKSFLDYAEWGNGFRNASWSNYGEFLNKYKKNYHLVTEHFNNRFTGRGL